MSRDCPTMSSNGEIRAWQCTEMLLRFPFRQLRYRELYRSLAPVISSLRTVLRQPDGQRLQWPSRFREQTRRVAEVPGSGLGCMSLDRLSVENGIAGAHGSRCDVGYEAQYDMCRVSWTSSSRHTRSCSARARLSSLLDGISQFTAVRCTWMSQCSRRLSPLPAHALHVLQLLRTCFHDDQVRRRQCELLRTSRWPSCNIVLHVLSSPTSPWTVGSRRSCIR